MIKQTRSSDQSGFTVVELLVAIIVSAVVISTVNLAIINLVHISKRNRDLVLANAYVEGKVEALRSAGFKSLTNGTTNISSELPSGLTPPRTGTMVISSVDAATEKVDISVSYNDQGTTRTYSYTTYIGELGVGQY